MAVLKTNEAAGTVDPHESSELLLDRIKKYWDTNVHDLKVSSHPVGTKEFFSDLREYHFSKLSYLPAIIDFPSYRGKSVLEVGCGVGIDLAEFAGAGAVVTGIDLSETTIELARKNFELNGLSGKFLVMNGEALDFEADTFDAVYAHGVVQYTADPIRMINEMHRVLKPGGRAIVTVYNKYSWLNLLSLVTKVDIEHADSPVLKKYSASELKGMLQGFPEVRIIVERFPVKTKLHRGIKGLFYNTVFVNLFNLIPRPIVRPFGWHIVATAFK